MLKSMNNDKNLKKNDYRRCITMLVYTSITFNSYALENSLTFLSTK